MKMQTGRQRISLGVKIIAPITVASMAAVVSGWLFITQLYNANLEKQTVLRGTAVSNLVKKFAETVGISPELEDVVKDIASEKDISHLVIFRRDPFGVIIEGGEVKIKGNEDIWFQKIFPHDEIKKSSS